MDAHQMAAELEAFAARTGFVAPPAYYIVGTFNLKAEDGSSVYSDEAHLWCRGCADALLSKAKAILPDNEQDDHFVCYTDAYGEDTCPHCMACGETLEGTVSETCVGNEVYHYAENPIGPDDTINPRQAIEISMILIAAPNNPDVIAIGTAALAAIKQLEGQ